MKTVFNVLEYGASGDGCTMNTAAIAKAVATVKAAGGGELYFPAGTYLSGTISAVDNLTIHLAPGTTLPASGDFSDYVIMYRLIFKFGIFYQLISSEIL